MWRGFVPASRLRPRRKRARFADTPQNTGVITGLVRSHRGIGKEMNRVGNGCGGHDDKQSIRSVAKEHVLRTIAGFELPGLDRRPGKIHETHSYWLAGRHRDHRDDCIKLGRIPNDRRLTRVQQGVVGK
jgi:hypothetical protein